MPDPNTPFTTWGDLDDDTEDYFWKAEPAEDDTVCVVCGKMLVLEGTPPGTRVCPLHGTRGVPK